MSITSDHTVDYSGIENGHCVLSYKYVNKILTIQFISNKGIRHYSNSEKNLLCELNQFRRAIKTQGNGLNYYANRLSQKLIVPIEDELNQYQSLSIVAEGDLLYFPFECLLNNGRLLIETHCLSYQTNLANCIKKKENKAPKSICFMAPMVNVKNRGGATYRNSINAYMSLPFSYNEIKTTEKICNKKQIKTTSLINLFATKSELTKALKSQDIVHIASHGDAINNGIFLHEKTDHEKADYVTFNGVNLISENVHCNLIILSACKTASKNNKQKSLSIQLINNGIPNVIGSLWNVHDKNTKTLMTLFYKYLVEDDLTYSEALQKAKIDCINKGLFAMDWAGFILFGQ